jgi:hypothetical protein
MAEESETEDPRRSARTALKKRLGLDDVPSGPRLSPIDGLPSSEANERELDLLCAAVTRGAAGKKFMTYLRTLTINRIAGPGVTPDYLLHLEGQRYLYGIIEKRAERGKVQK